MTVGMGWSVEGMVLMNWQNPNWMRVQEQVVLACTSPHSQRAYRDSIRGYLSWFSTTRQSEFSKVSVLKYRDYLLLKRKLAPKSINLQLTALRRLTQEALEGQLIDAPTATGILRIPMVPNRGVRAGVWLPREQANRILAGPNKRTLVGKRDYLVLMLILRCGLRRAEIAHLDMKVVRETHDRWVLANLRGKGKRVRTLPLPGVVKNAWESWVDAAGIESGCVIRAIDRHGTVWGQGVTEDTIWRIVGRYAQQALGKHVAPHDLRRTFGRLCYELTKDMREIQQLYGHSSVMTTERYLGIAQNLVDPVNDRLGLS
jgi:site-specific recombinase XerD